MGREKIKVMVVDDSAVVRQVVTATLASDPAIEVIGSAADPLFALKKMEKCWPDVIVLDVEMPRMDGISFLRKLMAERPTPVVICSSLTESNSETLHRALAAGAVEIITKPKVGLKGFLHESAKRLIAAVKAASQARLEARTDASAQLKVSPKLSADAVLPEGPALGGGAPLDKAASLRGEGSLHGVKTTEKLVVIGTSTGGTQALERVLKALPRVSPGIAIVQHMPEKFTEAFAQRLDGLCQINVREAHDGDRLLPGVALVAPGGRHLLVKRNGAQFHVEVRDGPLVNRHRPSVDVLFRSAARCAGPNALGIIMTGMGDDGARGLLEMRQAGAQTLGQDEASCVVYGMPKEAFKIGALQRSVDLEQIPREIIDYFHAQ
ncbi:chemotaxis response regulator protein-glutamate methylesterase [Motiliproteus sp. SC1-56]|uniref:protein-glutamate methylesterase/protein-glutamine glutaminase n=1 Tax=Motiliproteus sp. SC1-56 TaxID=2799565 RepID=UPI001A8F917B|nr:chemotaxis response regulator protein-glutamate methylesterase [Motiliproteus sp. SC1-56]